DAIQIGRHLADLAKARAEVTRFTSVHSPMYDDALLPRQSRRQALTGGNASHPRGDDLGWDPLPLRESGPLPHDGLFVRRNNAFGTRSTVSIRDLIEQGVLIEQAQIRFDDFVAAEPDDIPLPAAGDALVVSYGSSPATGTHKAQPETTHFVEI